MEKNTIYIEPSNLDYVIIKTKKSTVENEGIYEATRKAWHAKLSTAMPYKYALSVVQGVVMEVYEVEKWQMSGDTRIEFIGHVAPLNVREWFIGKTIPEKYRLKGLASPFLYKKIVEGELTKPIVMAEDEEHVTIDEFPTVRIGNQVWMAKNLAVTVDNEGNELILGEDYFYPNGDEANVEKYGLLYTWSAAMRIAPKGWKVPTADDWDELKDFCEKHFTADDEDGIGASIALAGPEGWDDYPEDETDHANATGFSAYPAGASDNNGEAFSFGFLSEFWSSTMLNRYVPYAFAFNGDFEDMWLDEDDEDENENLFFSVRCLQDAPEESNDLGSPSNDDQSIDTGNRRFITFDTRALPYIYLRQWRWYEEDEMLDKVKEYIGNNEAETLYDVLEDYPVDDVLEFIPVTGEGDENIYYQLESDSGDLIEEGELDIGSMELVGDQKESPDESSPKFILLHKDSVQTACAKFELPANMSPNDVHFFNLNWRYTPIWQEVTYEGEVDLRQIYVNGEALELDDCLDRDYIYGELKFALFQLKQRKRDDETIEYYYEKIMACED
ncbi:MAG: hypothetical protein MJZ70_02425 [Bacteroidales bacterium]|nr:hypothetical protein [Bacteroidales bacterium]